jgi:arsenate reductase
VSKPTVLFLCTGNSARSQIAEALLRHRAGDRFESASAGTKPAAEIHPLALRVLAEAGIPVAEQRPKRPEEVTRGAAVDHLVTVCDAAVQECPAGWYGSRSQAHWSLPDPAAADGTENDRLETFRRTLAEIDRRIALWLGAPSSSAT